MNPLNNKVAALSELPEIGARQHGRFLLSRRSLKEKKDEDKSDLSADNDSDKFDLRQNVRLEVKDIVQDKTIWSRDFPQEMPRFSFDEFSGRLFFYWNLGRETGQAKLKESAELQAKASALGDTFNDYLVEIVDAFTQKTVGVILLETGNGSFNIGKGLSEGDWLVLHDSKGRVLVYSIKEGELRHRFFGGNAVISPKKNQIAVENLSGEVALYDLETGDRQAIMRSDGEALDPERRRRPVLLPHA